MPPFNHDLANVNPIIGYIPLPSVSFDPERYNYTV